MAIEGFIVRFNAGKSANQVRDAIRQVAQHDAAWNELEEHVEPFNASGTVWQVAANGQTAIRTEGEAWDMAYSFRSTLDDVARAEPVYLVVGMPVDEPSPSHPLTFGSSGDRHLPQSEAPDWPHAKLNIAAAWARLADQRPGEPPGLDVSIAHPDTGYTAHPELASLTTIDVGRARNFKDNGVATAVDPLSGEHAGHGTATSSVFLSHGTPHVQPGVAGVAPGATLVPIRMQDSVYHFFWGKLVRSLYYAADSGAQVVSMSLGGPWGGDSLRDAVEYATNKGVILIAAAGNKTPFVCYPAKYNGVVAMAASNAIDELWWGSALGNSVDLTAPGESVWRAHAELDAGGVPVYRVARSSGTSYATALTAGVCALWIHYHGHAALHQKYGGRLSRAFAEVARASARTPPNWPTHRAGAGIVDADALLAAPLPAAAPVPLAAPTFHPRLLDVAQIRGTSVSDASAWLVDQLGTPPSSLASKLDDVGAELTLLLTRRSLTPTAPAPISMSARPGDIRSKRLAALAPRIQP